MPRRLFLLTMPLLLLACFFINQNSLAAQTNQWTLASSTMPTARTGMSSVVIGQKIYVIGGRLYMNASSYEDKNEVYDTENDVWETKAPMPTGRWGATAATVDGKLFLVAAGSPIPQGSQNLEEYNPESDSWSQKAEMPQPGWGAVSAVADGKIYVVGGYNWANQGMNYNREYDPKTNIWTLKAPMPTSRSWLGAETINGKIYVVGGWNWNDTIDLATLEIYDPKTDIWETKAPMPKGLRGIATAALDNQLYVIGGEQGDGYNPVLHDSVLVYDPETNVWQELSLKLPKPISVAEAQTVAGVIYLIGGYTYGQELNSVYYWPEKTSAPEPAAPEPVILVPGIMGSYLYSSIDPGVEVWPAVGKTVADPWDFHLNQLIMDEEGKPSANSMVVPPQDIIRSVLDKDFFQGLINELKQNGYEENKNLFVFPYDWRLDLNWSTSGIPYSGFDSLKDKIEQIKLQTGVSKVNIIAHSMGGLVAKNYLKHYGAGSVDKFIDIGTPHLGAPEAFKILMYGDDLGYKSFGIQWMNLDRVKTISQNFPSVYQLLPSQDYFNSANQDYAYYIYDLYDLDNNGIKSRLDYTQSIDFLKNTGRNNYLLGFNDILHSDLDSYSPVADGVKTYNIIGCGQPTIGQIFVLNKEQSGKYEYGLKYISGDGTVPLRSAEALIADDSYYIKGAEHSTLPSANGIKQITAAILKDTIGSFLLQDYPAVSHNSADCSLTGTQISFHSPIELNVYDESNNHVGPNENGDIELGIVGAQYDDLDGNKFVFLPTGHNYRVVGQATANGSFNARVQTVQDGQYVETMYYNQVPLNSSSTVAQLQINNGQIVGIMEIDQNGDQIFETQAEPSAILNQDEAADLIKPETQIEISGTIGDNGYYISTTTATLTATDNQGGSGVLKTEYSLDNGQSWQDYESPIIFNNDGEYNIIYKSTDRAGNVEEEKTRTLKIDKIAPVINILLPLEAQEFMRDEFFTPEYEIADNYSGVATSSLELSLDGQPISQAEQDLFYYSLGQHVLKIAVLDLAGNRAEASVKFTVSADLDSTISDVNRSYSLGWIKNEKAKNWLVKELNEIKKYQEKFGQRQKRLEQKQEKTISQCLKKKSQTWCEEKLGKRYDKAVYRLSQNYKKTIIKRYQEILKKLESYYKKQWLNQSAYDIIKADVEYLISKL